MGVTVEQFTGVTDIRWFGWLVAEPRQIKHTIAGWIKSAAKMAEVAAAFITTDMFFYAFAIIHAGFTAFDVAFIYRRYCLPVVFDFLGNGRWILMKPFGCAYKGFIQKNSMLNICPIR